MMKVAEAGAAGTALPGAMGQGIAGIERALAESQPRERMVVGDGEIAFLAEGPVDGPAVLWLHGFPRNARVWRGCLEIAGAAGYRCLAPDLPGLGESEGPQAADYSLAGQARLLAAFLDRAGARSVCMVAEGIGARVALALAALAEGRVHGIALLDPDLLDRRGSPLAVAGAMARAGAGGVVLGALRVLRGLARLDLRPSAGAYLERTGELYLRPILADPAARARAASWLAGLRRPEAREALEALLHSGAPPVLVASSRPTRRASPGAPVLDSGVSFDLSKDAGGQGLWRGLPRSHLLPLPDRAVRLLERSPRDVAAVLLPFLAAVTA